MQSPILSALLQDFVSGAKCLVPTKLLLLYNYYNRDITMLSRAFIVGSVVAS